MKTKKSIKISIVAVIVVAMLLLTQFHTLALEAEESAITEITSSSENITEENTSEESNISQEADSAPSDELEDILAQEDSSVSSDSEVSEGPESEVQLEELTPFAEVIGSGTQADPYIIDITDTDTIPVTGYTVSAFSSGKYIFTLNEPGAFYTVNGGTQSSPTLNSIMIGANDITLNLSDVYISVSDAKRVPLDTQNYNVTLNLLDGTTNGFMNSSAPAFKDATSLEAGILHTPDKGNSEVSGELKIQGKGSLEAAGGYTSAGIGGGKIASGTIVIAEQATVTAKGGMYSAGVGGGYQGANGKIQIIDDASINASGGKYGAGLGGGYGANGGIIEISTSGTVVAAGGDSGSGIGGGYHSDAGTITISGSGVVKATGGGHYNSGYSGGAGIGTGGSNIPINNTYNLSTIGNITITSGTVFATGGALSPGIGYAKGFGITGTSNGVISGGNVYVTGEYPAGQMQIKNGQADNAEVFQNLLAVQDLTTVKDVESFAADGADWYQMNGTQTFSLSDSTTQQYISVWLPKTSQGEAVFSQIGTIKYRAYYERDNSTPSTTTEETLYEKVNITIKEATGGSGHISEVNGVSVSESQIPDIYPNDTIVISANPLPGYDFVSWDVQGVSISESGKTASSFSFVVPGDVTIVPSFKAKEYAITYELNGGTDADITNPSVYTYGIGVESLASPTRTGYKFLNWYDDADFSNVVTSISDITLGDITLYAKWEANSYSITYELNGGTNDGTNPDSYIYGQGISNFVDPSKRGYTFVGWYGDSAFSNVVTSISDTELGDVTLYANWKANKYSILYNLAGGTNSSQNPSEYTYGVGVSGLGDANRVGYSFVGWYSDANFANAVNSISATDIDTVTLYAKWEANRYTITYNLNGGTNNAENPDSYAYGTGVPSFAKPERKGYTFDGWYEDAALKNVVTSISGESLENVTLYAKWSPKLYTLTYLTYDLKEIKTTSFYMDQNVLMLEAPTVGGHHFAGWVIEGTNTKWKSSSKMPADDISLVATYDKNTNDSGTSTSTTSPKTGDTSNLVLPIILIVAAVGALVIVFFVVRKIKRNNRQM